MQEKDPRGRKPKWERPPKLTRLQRTAQLTPPCPRPQLLLRRWRRAPVPLLSGKEKGKEIHDNWHARLSKDELVLYSDGSQDRQTGWGFVVYLDGAPIHHQHGSIKRAEVFDAEAIAARMAAEWAVGNADRLKPKRIHFCLDNTAVIRRGEDTFQITARKCSSSFTKHNHSCSPPTALSTGPLDTWRSLGTRQRTKKQALAPQQSLLSKKIEKQTGNRPPLRTSDGSTGVNARNC